MSQQQGRNLRISSLAPSSIRPRGRWREGTLLFTTVAVWTLGCGGGPAWPRSAGTVAVEDWKEDGGESIAPHTSRASAIERSAEPVVEPKIAEVPPPQTELSGEGTGSASAAPAADAPVELLEEIQGEEIIIEIEDE
jgi:hypothetical protein